jgi:hypothetical protein
MYISEANSTTASRLPKLVNSAVRPPITSTATIGTVRPSLLLISSGSTFREASLSAKIAALNSVESTALAAETSAEIPTASASQRLISSEAKSSAASGCAPMTSGGSRLVMTNPTRM